MTYSLRVWWKLPELSDRLMVRDSRNQECRAFFEKSGRNRIGITLLRQLNKILDISDLEAGLIVEKSGGVFGDKDECGEDDVELLVRERRSLDILLLLLLTLYGDSWRCICFWLRVLRRYDVCCHCKQQYSSLRRATITIVMKH